MKLKVGDLVVMKKRAVKNNNTRFTTGIVRAIELGMISVKRDFYRGHEFTWWDSEDWRKVEG